MNKPLKHPVATGIGLSFLNVIDPGLDLCGEKDLVRHSGHLEMPVARRYAVDSLGLVMPVLESRGPEAVWCCSFALL